MLENLECIHGRCYLQVLQQFMHIDYINKNVKAICLGAICPPEGLNSTLLSRKDALLYNKNLIIFGIFSLLSAYTHYYGLMASGIINLMLFFYLIKNRKNRKQDFIKFMIVAVIQVLIYMPWLVCFVTQLGGVASGFWIELKFPDSLIKIINLQFCDNINQYVALAFAVVLYIYIGTLIYKEKKAKNEIKPAVIAIRNIYSEL